MSHGGNNTQKSRKMKVSYVPSSGVLIFWTRTLTRTPSKFHYAVVVQWHVCFFQITRSQSRGGNEVLPSSLISYGQLQKQPSTDLQTRPGGEDTARPTAWIARMLTHLPL